MNLRVDGGCYAHQPDRPLLESVSFEVGEGEVMAILGPNGVGKTTLVRATLGFLPWQSGTTILDGRPLSAYRERELWRRVAYVPQARPSTFSLLVEEMVLLGRSPWLGPFAMPGKEDLEIVQAAMEQAGITALRGKRCGSLSGGELQLTLIARALAGQPEILVLDEPESGLDFRNQLVVLQLIERLAREKKMSVVLNTHYPDHALRISDSVLLLFGGGVYQTGRTDRMLTREHLRALFGVDIALWENQGKGHYAAVIPLEIDWDEGGQRWTRQ